MPEGRLVSFTLETRFLVSLRVSHGDGQSGCVGVRGSGVHIEGLGAGKNGLSPAWKYWQGHVSKAGCWGSGGKRDSIAPSGRTGKIMPAGAFQGKLKKLGIAHQVR